MSENIEKVEELEVKENKINDKDRLDALKSLVRSEEELKKEDKRYYLSVERY